VTVDCETGEYDNKKTARFCSWGGCTGSREGFWGVGDPLTDDGELVMCGGAGRKGYAFYGASAVAPANTMIDCNFMASGNCICNKDYSIVIAGIDAGIYHTLAEDIIDFTKPGLFVNTYPGGWRESDPYDGYALQPEETLFNEKERKFLYGQLCDFSDGRGDGIVNYRPTTTTTTTTSTTTTDDGHPCKHYESEDECPAARCSWDGVASACADPPCSSFPEEGECCGDCEWLDGMCQPAMFKACPREGKPGTNKCPKGCTFVDNCEQCEFAAGVWKKDFSKLPWKPSTGSRPQGCFRNRKFNIKCNKFEPGSKYPNGKSKVGTKRGKWPICKLIEPPQKC